MMATTLPPETASAPDLIAIAAHELRTPLTVVAALAQILERDVQKQLRRGAPAANEWLDEQQVLLAKMHELGLATVRLKTLAEELLMLRGTEAGCQMATDLRVLIETLLSDYRLLAGEHPLRLRADEHPCLVWVNPTRIEQVVRNLVDNALAYSPTGGTVDLSVRSSAEAVELTVHDEGCGIPTDQLEAIFMPFYRGTNSTELEISGSGLGLYVSARIVQAHHGQIWAESVPMHGSTFFVRLPRYELRQFSSGCGTVEAL